MNFTIENLDVGNKSQLNCGILKLPGGVEIQNKESLLFVGEDELYLHCFTNETGNYIGIYKSEDPKHIYQLILKHNF